MPTGLQESKIDFKHFESLIKEMKDMSSLYLKNYEKWTNELKGTIALFGDCEAVKKLIKRFPDAYEVIVDLDPEKQGQKVKSVRIISFEEFKKNKTKNIIITDTRLQYTYLHLIYEKLLFPEGLGLTDIYDNTIPIRYNYNLKGNSHGYEPSIFDFEFLKIKKSLPMKCNIPTDSLVRLMDCVKTSMKLEGDILEIGTGLGGSTYYMASVIESLGANKEVYSIDLFEPINYIPDLNFEAVSENLKKFPFVTIIKGRFPERLYSLDIEKIAFAFIDEYAYPDIMEYIYPRMTRGGIILIDNYNHGCDKNHGIPICNLFFQDKKEKILRVGGSHGLIVKQ